jgi:hypothetical protein
VEMALSQDLGIAQDGDDEMDGQID